MTVAMKNVQIVIGSRIIDMPGARKLRTVMTKLRPPIVNEAMNSAIPSSHSVWPHCEPPGTALQTALSGGYAVQPAAAAPPSTKNDASMMTLAGTTTQYESMLRNGNAMSRAPICSGIR